MPAGCASVGERRRYARRALAEDSEGDEMSARSIWTVGVEEEYQILDAATGALRPRGGDVLSSAQEALGDEVQPELKLSQVETASPVCGTLADVRAAIVAGRRGVIEAAAAHGCRIAAAGTHPFSDWHAQPVTPKDRYQRTMVDFGLLAREHVIFGCHVHVGLADREAAVRVLNRARAWLSPLLALAANSPFWLGEETGYASYRTEIWSRWPMAGPPLPFASYADYCSLIGTLVATGDVIDATRIYWDVRLPEKVPTIEFRVTDVCMAVDEAVMIAGLTRALVRTCHEQALRDEPFAPVRHELLRIAHWHAARYGLEADLIHPVGGRVPAGQLIETFLVLLRDALEAAGDWDEVAGLVRETLRRGNGAARQRAAFARAGRWEDVTQLIVAETAAGVAAVA